MENLQDMTVSRWSHGCAGYMKDGKLVCRYSENLLAFVCRDSLSAILCTIQVYLVVGGRTGAAYTDTTEVYSGGRWRTVGALPVAVSGLAGVTIENTVYMTGLYDT